MKINKTKKTCKSIPVEACKKNIIDHEQNHNPESSWNPEVEDDLSSIITPPSTPKTKLSCVSSKWKQLLEKHDKIKSKSGGSKINLRKPSKQTKKRIQETPKHPVKISIDIESLTIMNFTEQILALELIQDYLKNEN